MEENKNPTQCERIKKYLLYFGSITALEAMKDLGIMRLASRMSELKKQGYQFYTKQEVVKNRYHKDTYITRYFAKNKENAS